MDAIALGKHFPLWSFGWYKHVGLFPYSLTAPFAAEFQCPPSTLWHIPLGCLTVNQKGVLDTSWVWALNVHSLCVCSSYVEFTMATKSKSMQDNGTFLSVQWVFFILLPLLPSCHLHYPQCSSTPDSWVYDSGLSCCCSLDPPCKEEEQSGKLTFF